MTRPLLKNVLMFIFAMGMLFINSGDSMAEMNNGLMYSPMQNAGFESGSKYNIIFGVFAEDETELRHAAVLAESIRTFGGKYKDSPVWVYIPKELLEMDKALDEKFQALDVQVKTSRAPKASLSFYFARKVFAASQAEREAEEKTNILVWLDNDTVILQEPGVFELSEGIVFGYRPVTHKNVGSLYSEPPDEFWSLVYKNLNVSDRMIFPMETFTDRLMIRPYFNAGVLIVRPEAAILRKWAEVFPVLYSDSAIVEMCRQDNYKRIFLHQVALAGAVPLLISKDQMLRLPDNVNYPIFFQAMYGADKEYDDLSNVITLRYDVYFRNPVRDWADKLRGPEEVINWLREHLGN
jgi:hypothetical protein